MVGRDSSNSRDCVDVRFTPANYRIEPGLDHKGLRGLSTAASTNPRLERILASDTIVDPSSRGNDGPGRNKRSSAGPGPHAPRIRASLCGA